MKSTLLACTLSFALGAIAADAKMDPIYTVPHELDMLVKDGHIQGACCSEQGIYLSHQSGIEKIDWTGKVVAHADAPRHLGDVAFANGRIYGAFVLRGIPKNDPNPGALYVWDENLKLIAKRRVPFALDGACVIEDTLFSGIDRWGHVSHPGAAIASFDLDLNLKGTNDVDFGFWIHYGVQTMATDGKDLYCCNYAPRDPTHNPKKHNTARLTSDGQKLLGTCYIPGSEGFGLVPKSISKRETPVFFAVRAQGGNMQGWRKDPVNNPPRIRIEFFELRDGKFVNITKK